MPKGHEGLVFMTALAVNNSGTGVGFLEGCPHLFDPPDAAWPGILLGSGTEDYFDSGWYFNAGEKVEAFDQFPGPKCATDRRSRNPKVRTVQSDVRCLSQV